MVVGSAPALGFLIDGNLDDWGVTVADDGGSTYGFLPTINLLGSHVEDQNDHAGNGVYLGPNYGGQDYDAEMMAVAHEGGRYLSVAIVTGQRPDNGFRLFAPGDIRIETSAGIYGIEVGGGAGGGAGSAITEGGDGSTYNLTSSGYTQGHTMADSPQGAGSIWTKVTWLLDPINPKEVTQFQIDPLASTFVGTADYVYTRDTVTNQHAIIELTFDALPLAGMTIESMHWRPACGNDELDVDLDFVPVPEPTGLLILLAGGLTVLIPKQR